MTKEQFITAQRMFYFMWEALIGDAIIVLMTVLSLIFGTFMISHFGDVGGFTWLGVTYVAFIAFDPLYSRLVKSMRKSMSPGILP